MHTLVRIISLDRFNAYSSIFIFLSRVNLHLPSCHPVKVSSALKLSVYDKSPKLEESFLNKIFVNYSYIYGLIHTF